MINKQFRFDLKIKFLTVKFKKRLKPIFQMFQGKFHLEDQGQGQIRLRPLCDQYTVQV